MNFETKRFTNLFAACGVVALSHTINASALESIKEVPMDAITMSIKLKKDIDKLPFVEKVPLLTKMILIDIAKKAVETRPYLKYGIYDGSVNPNSIHFSWQITFSRTKDGDYKVFPFSDTRICGTFKRGSENLFSKDAKTYQKTMLHLWGNNSYIDNTCSQGLNNAVFTKYPRAVMIKAIRSIIDQAIVKDKKLREGCPKSELRAARLFADFKDMRVVDAKIYDSHGSELKFRSKDKKIYKGYWQVIHGKMPSIILIVACGNINNPKSVSRLISKDIEKKNYIPYSFPYLYLDIWKAKGDPKGNLTIIHSFTSNDGKFYKDIK